MSLPGPYIVEKSENIFDVAIEIPEVTGLFDALQSRFGICQFNGYWPKPEELHVWVHQNWTENCDIYLCAKGYFVVQFDNAEDYIFATIEVPWFWGRTNLFVTPWFLGFDANTMVVTKIPAWV